MEKYIDTPSKGYKRLKYASLNIKRSGNYKTTRTNNINDRRTYRLFLYFNEYTKMSFKFIKKYVIINANFIDEILS